MSSITKTCSLCNKLLPITEFYGNKCRCKACTRQRKKKYVDANKEKVKEQNRKSYYKNIYKHKDKLRLKRQDPILREISRKASQEWHDRNSKAANKRREEFHLNNPTFRVLSVIKARGIKHNYPVYIIDTDITLRGVVERGNYICHICGNPIYTFYKPRTKQCATIDHIIPLCRGGEHSWNNVAPAHLSCNCKKHMKIL